MQVLRIDRAETKSINDNSYQLDKLFVHCLNVKGNINKQKINYLFLFTVKYKFLYINFHCMKTGINKNISMIKEHNS